MPPQPAIASTPGAATCRLPRSWDRFEPGFARVMGPPELPVVGPPSACLPGWRRPAVCDHFRSFDLEVAGGVPGGSCARGTRGSAAWVGSELGQRPIAERAGVDRKTVRRYIDAAVAAGVVRDGGPEQLTDELVGQVINAVRPERAQGHGPAWDRLLLVEDDIRGWVRDGLQLTTICCSEPRRARLISGRGFRRPRSFRGLSRLAALASAGLRWRR
jgi:hypothetical protein